MNPDVRAAVATREPDREPAPPTKRDLPRALRGAVPFGVIALVALGWLFPSPSLAVGFDLRVYRGAIAAALSDGGLYTFALPDDGWYPAYFLYPPFAALLGALAMWIPLGAAATMWTLCQLGMSGVLVWLLARATGASGAGPGREPLLVLCLAWILFVLTRPVIAGIGMGQVSLLITTLVAVDLLLLPRRWKGVLIGIAAGIKLTPMLFAVHFLLTRQWRAARNSALSFLASVALGFVAFPAESIGYWTRIVFDSSRVPGLGSQMNLSILGQLQFWGVPEPFVKPLWIGVCLVFVAVALRLGVLRHRAGDDASALVMVGTASALASPVAWDHFLVWLSLAALLLGFTIRRSTRAAGWLLLCLLSALSPVWPVSSPDGLRQFLGLVPVAVALWVSLGGLPGRHRHRRDRVDVAG
ncbi:glycosyltransferase 87 family protein [Propionicimonas sp.]|uniref:glycosyltransferase 87 family protein n=1 Tax=Propionicimonas sp. TaxID=1955623 RepID=UPI0039E63846